jgi:hypothetical protein
MQRNPLNIFTQNRFSEYCTGLIAWTSHQVTSLSGYIKRKLAKCDIPDRQRLQSAVMHIFDEIVQKTL